MIDPDSHFSSKKDNVKGQESQGNQDQGQVGQGEVVEVRNTNNKRQQVKVQDNSDSNQRSKKVKLNILDHFKMVCKD